MTRFQWVTFRDTVVSRNLSAQYFEIKNVYVIKAADGFYEMTCIIRKESPASADQTDFETNYKDLWNAPVELRSSEGPIIVEHAPRVGTAGTKALSLVSHDFSDRTSWYQKSIQVVDETLTTGDDLEFSSTNPWWVDSVSPASRMTYAYNRVPKRDGSYGKHGDWAAVVKVDSVVVTSGFTIDYVTGKVTFDVAQTGSTVTATYWHTNNVARCSEWLLVPPAGSKYILDHVELQFSKDTSIDDTIRFEFWAGADLATYGDFNDSLFDAGYGQVRADYRNISDLINSANLGTGSIPASSGLTKDVLVFPFNYVKAELLDSAIGTLGRAALLNDTPFTNSELATATFYLTSKPS